MITLALITVFLYMASWFVISKIVNRNDVVDIAWGLGFVVLGWVLYYNRPSVQLSLAVILVTIWGVRLSTHLFMRVKSKPEDYRYKKWREEWGSWFTLRSFFQVFILQGICMLLIAAPLIGLSINGQDSLHVINYAGVIVWSIGFFFETMADYELKQFIKNPNNKGKIIQSGLWKYSRHPNYFGEVTQWWGIWLIAFGAPSFLLAVIGPLTITFLILKLSGIPMLEKKYEGNKEFEAYKQKTSVFFPLPTKKGL